MGSLKATGMRGLAEFTKTTILGGVLVVLPLWFSLLLLAKAAVGVFALLAPVTAQLPPDMQLRRIVAILIVVAVCFLVGLVVRTGPGLRAKSALDRYLLERIPGYTLLRGLAGRLTGEEEGTMFAVALVEIEDALVPAFVVEEHADGAYTVFVPSVPTPAAGTVYILERARVHLVDVPFTKAVSVISKWGAGSRDLLAAMQPRSR
jgi:uncharacterized membrane protein